MAFIKIFKKKDKTTQINSIIDRLDDVNKKYYLDLATITIAFIFGVVKTVKKHETSIISLEREIEDIRSKGE